ncbi:MAG: hypothetical protein ACRC1H_20505 [Caldilineaceae bacterium]
MRHLPFLLALLLLAACSSPQLPEIPDLPGLTEELRQIPEALQDLQLPDLSGIELPSLDTLPQLSAPPGSILFSGPSERRLEVGERLPGTDISFTGIENGQAVFSIAGMRSPRATGDSLEFSGAWPGLPGSDYSAHYRIYRIGEQNVRVAGVHQLLVPNISPQVGAAPAGAFEIRFPYTDAVNVGGETIAGTTLGYLGKYERGAQLTGLPMSDYPYRATGDSILWEGTLRPDIGARFNLRMLTYGADGARVGGTVALFLPGS